MDNNLNEELHLFSDMQLFNTAPSGVIKLSTNFIRGASGVKKRKIQRGGNTIIINEATPNDKKIEDTCIEIYQDKELRRKIDYKTLQNEAILSLSGKFEEYDLVPLDSYSKIKNKEINRIRNIAIDNYIKNEVSQLIPKTIKYPIRDFINRTGIKRIRNRFNEALKVISESSVKLSHSWVNQSVEFIEKDGKKKAVVINDLTQGSIIPKFTLRFNDNMKKHFNDEEILKINMEKLIELDIPNKEGVIDYIILETDPKTVLEIVGVGLFGSLFGRGYARSERRNRNLYKKSTTFDFDLLVRSIINIPENSTLTHFTFEQLKDILGANSHIDWESFKKNILMPVIKEQEQNTEIRCEYELIPNRKNWTHIKLIPKWKTNSLGFDASKGGYDFLAYYIAVQHKYFQKNSLDESLENFIPYVQSIIYTYDDGEIVFDKTLQDWKEIATKAYYVEKELLAFMENNPVLLDDNNIFYDSRIMCLLKRNYLKETELIIFDGEKEVDREPKRKNSFIKAHLYKVNDSITSIRYLYELVTKGKENISYYIFDFIPFKFATLDGGWKNINTLEDYQQYKDLMRSAVYKKKSSFFKFPDEEINKKEQFLINMERMSFKEIDNNFKELMISITS